ncbi:MAG: NUDIX domain-containing protein [Clostridium sp.]|nr:NUDIX domain-containing protein [Clostridium sp.]
MVDKTFGERIEGEKYEDRHGAYLICIRDGKAAVAKTPKGYFLLGGGIEESDGNHIECITREIIEEIGYSSKVESYLCSAEVFVLHERRGYFHPVQYYYYGEINEKVQDPIEKDHVLEWIPLENIEEKMYVKAQGWAINCYIKNIMNNVVK